MHVLYLQIEDARNYKATLNARVKEVEARIKEVSKPGIVVASIRRHLKKMPICMVLLVNLKHTKKYLLKFI
jgi:hypothetical protein